MSAVERHEVPRWAPSGHFPDTSRTLPGALLHVPAAGGALEDLRVSLPRRQVGGRPARRNEHHGRAGKDHCHGPVERGGVYLVDVPAAHEEDEPADYQKDIARDH